ncbi:hypothetical protein E3N88_16663 [Mikania micrantha]|uniref:Uncharacterized protein n=1 Tax=Mikania micrantha TaxID=192012 RepID=A0A5N6P144_9ASTR|nr:hypothetical protein E3N88_16663 [Mikania micrantha]
MDPSVDHNMNIDKPPDPKEFPPLELGTGKWSSPRLAIATKSKKQKEITGLSREGKSKSSFVNLNVNNFVKEANNEVEEALQDTQSGRGEEGADMRFSDDQIGFMKAGNGLIMASRSSMAHGDGDLRPKKQECGTNKEDEFPMTSESEFERTNPSDTDMGSDDEQQSGMNINTKVDRQGENGIDSEGFQVAGKKNAGKQGTKEMGVQNQGKFGNSGFNDKSKQKGWGMKRIGTSSDMSVQKKMGELHQRFKEDRNMGSKGDLKKVETK